MQYITQCPRYPRVITTRSRKNNYLLSQIVKEQPKDVSKKHQSTSRTSAMLIAASSIATRPCHAPDFSGGANRDRTGDLLLAKQALSQLSYSPPQGSGIRDQMPDSRAL